MQCCTRVIGEDAPLYLHGAVAARVVLVARREAAQEFFAHNLAHFALKVLLRARIASKGGVIIAVDMVNFDTVAAAESIEFAHALGRVGFAVHETHPVELGVEVVGAKEIFLTAVHVRDAKLVDVD